MSFNHAYNHNSNRIHHNNKDDYNHAFNFPCAHIHDYNISLNSRILSLTSTSTASPATSPRRARRAANLLLPLSSRRCLALLQAPSRFWSQGIGLSTINLLLPTTAQSSPTNLRTVLLRSSWGTRAHQHVASAQYHSYTLHYM